MGKYHKKHDQELLALLREGDCRAFDELYERYWEKLLYFAYQKTGNQMDAENVLQDVFVSLWNRRTTLQINSDLSSYLAVSVKYRIIRLFEQRRSQRIREQESLSSFNMLDDSTQEFLEFEELKAQLEQFVSKLPQRSRLIYKLSREDGLSHQEIAEQLGTTERAINADLVRTKKNLLSTLRSFMNTYFL